jgi:hypothetical protein
MKVVLNTRLFEYLLRSSFLSPRERALIMMAAPSEKGYCIEVSDGDADAIRDACGEQLQRVGFGVDYKTTPEGEMLEQLVDAFFVASIRRNGE